MAKKFKVTEYVGSIKGKAIRVSPAITAAKKEDAALLYARHHGIPEPIVPSTSSVYVSTFDGEKRFLVVSSVDTRNEVSDTL